MATGLAPVYLDDARVQLQGDPRPKVSKIVAAGGKSAGHVRIVRLASLADEQGEPVQFDDVIDRSQQQAPVYLRSIVEETTPATGASKPFKADETTGVGRVRAGTAFGAARPGMAGKGAQGSPGRLPLDKQAKSDFDPDQSSGASHQPILDGTQASQSGGRQGEGGAPGYSDASVGSRGLELEGGSEPAPGTGDGPGSGELRDQSTDSAGRQQGQRPKRPVAKARETPSDSTAGTGQSAGEGAD